MRNTYHFICTVSIDIQQIGALITADVVVGGAGPVTKDVMRIRNYSTTVATVNHVGDRFKPGTRDFYQGGSTVAFYFRRYYTANDAKGPVLIDDS
jgi:hypothetical protein